MTNQRRTGLKNAAIDPEIPSMFAHMEVPGARISA
jgi:hypothetical protein